MLHHHGHEKQMTEAEREQLLNGGAVTQAMVLHSESAAADRRISQVRLTVSFSG